MRRLVAFFVVALLGACIYGVSNSSSGVSLDHQTISGNELRSELSDIVSHPGLACYIEALDGATYVHGAGGDTVKIDGASAWANIRVEGLAINRYVKNTMKYTASKSALNAAKADLVNEMTSEASQRSLKCSGTASQALANMTPEMRSAEVQSEATSLYLVRKLKNSIPLTTASEQSFYEKHTSSYDTLCISVAVVTQQNIAAFQAGQAAGDSVAELAEKYSADSSAATGGAYGCYSPSSSAYATIRSDVGSVGLNQFPQTPEEISYGGAVADLYVAVTKRTVTPFAQAQAAVLSDLQEINAEAANELKNGLLYAAAVHVDPAFGIWGASTSSGLSVFAPSVPPTNSVLNPTKLSTAGTSTYK